MVESTCFQHTSSHPDKYNNSVDRIISKEEEREDPRRDSSIYLRIQWCLHIQSVSACNPATPSNSAYRINSPTRNTTTTRLIPCHPMQTSTRHHPATVPRVSKHSTWQNPAIRLPAPYSTPSAPHGTSRLPTIQPGRNSILSGSQHPHNPYSSSQAHSYRILTGEIGFTPKG